jgi:hypothetical protein
MTTAPYMLVAVPAGKGCVLYLTRTEYEAAVDRGKRITRARRLRQRINDTPPGRVKESFRVSGKGQLLTPLSSFSICGERNCCELNHPVT